MNGAWHYGSGSTVQREFVALGWGRFFRWCEIGGGRLARKTG